MERRFREYPVQIETREAGASRIVGYGAVFYDGTDGTEYRLWSDLVERIMPGAFDRAIREDDVRGLFNHDANFVLGRTKSGTMALSVDSKGLRYDIDMPDTQSGKDVLESVRRGDVTGSSFSFIPTTVTWRTEKGVDIREINEVQLFDVGPVAFPAYESTTAEARSRDMQDALQARDCWKESQANTSHAARARELRLKELAADL